MLEPGKIKTYQVGACVTDRLVPVSNNPSCSSLESKEEYTYRVTVNVQYISPAK